MKNLFSIQYVSDNEHEKLTAEIHFKEQILCQISQDEGLEKLEIEFFHLYYTEMMQPNFKFSLQDFLDIVQEAIAGFE